MTQKPSQGAADRFTPPEGVGGADDPPSSAEWLDGTLRCVPSALVDAAAARRLLGFARTLPESAGDELVMFEFRLGEAKPTADLAVQAEPHTAFADYLVARGEAEGASPASRGLARYLRDIGRPESFLARWLGYVMLEYDLADAGGGKPLVPGVFLGSRINLPAVGAERGFVRWRHGNPGVMTAAVCHAVGWEEVDRERREVQRVCDLLPWPGYSRHVGAMPGREPRAIRLIVGLPAEAVPGYLASAGWPGRLDLAGELLAEAVAFDLEVMVALDVGADGLLPGLGFELLVRRGWKAPAPLWRPFLKRLLALGLCLPEKERALRSWPRFELLYLASGAQWLLSGLNHVKLSIADGSVSAKAYPMVKLVAGASIVP